METPSAERIRTTGREKEILDKAANLSAIDPAAPAVFELIDHIKDYVYKSKRLNSNEAEAKIYSDKLAIKLYDQYMTAKEENKLKEFYNDKILKPLLETDIFIKIANKVKTIYGDQPDYAQLRNAFQFLRNADIGGRRKTRKLRKASRKSRRRHRRRA